VRGKGPVKLEAEAEVSVELSARSGPDRRREHEERRRRKTTPTENIQGNDPKQVMIIMA